MAIVAILVGLLSLFMLRSFSKDLGTDPNGKGTFDLRSPDARPASQRSASGPQTPGRWGTDPDQLLVGTWEATGQGSKVFTGSMGTTYLQFQVNRGVSMVTVIDYDAYWRTHPDIYEAVKELDVRRGLPVPGGVQREVAMGRWTVIRPGVFEITLKRTSNGVPPAVSDMVFKVMEAFPGRIVGTVTYKAGEALQDMPPEDPAPKKRALALVLHRAEPATPPVEPQAPSGT